MDPVGSPRSRTGARGHAGSRARERRLAYQSDGGRPQRRVGARHHRARVALDHGPHARGRRLDRQRRGQRRQRVRTGYASRCRPTTSRRRPPASRSSTCCTVARAATRRSGRPAAAPSSRSPTAARSSPSCPTAARSAGTPTGSTRPAGRSAGPPSTSTSSSPGSTPTCGPLPPSRPGHRRTVDGRVRRHPLRPGPARPVRLRRPASPAPSTSVTLGSAATVTEQSIQNGLPAYGAFGPPFWPADGTWNALNPLGRASRLHGVDVALYAGSGIHDADVLERTVGAATDRMHHSLNAAGVPHFYWMYGRPGPSVPYGCDGGHNFSCWNFALNDAMPRMMAVLQAPPPPPPPPPPATSVVNPGFENIGLAPWACAGSCGQSTEASASPAPARQRLGPQHHRLERPPPDDRRRAADRPTRSAAGCGRRPPATTATSDCARQAAPCSASSGSVASTATRGCPSM